MEIEFDRMKMEEERLVNIPIFQKRNDGTSKRVYLVEVMRNG